MALVKSFPRRFAEMASEALEKEGIPSVIFGARGYSVPQGADLHVKDEHAERAREIVSALFGALLRAPRCPRRAPGAVGTSRFPYAARASSRWLTVCFDPTSPTERA